MKHLVRSHQSLYVISVLLLIFILPILLKDHFLTSPFPVTISLFIVLSVVIKWWLHVLTLSFFVQQNLSHHDSSIHWKESFHASLNIFLQRQLWSNPENILNKIHERYMARWPHVELDDSGLKEKLCWRIDPNCFNVHISLGLFLILDYILISVFLWGESLFLTYSFFVIHLVFIFFPLNGVAVREVLILFMLLMGISLPTEDLNLYYSLSISWSVGSLLSWVSGRLVLQFWRSSKPISTNTKTNVQISVIIPARNEEAEIQQVIELIFQHSNLVSEIIVVDGQSEDKTKDIALQCGAKVLSCPPGRGRQLRVGSENAQSEILFYCHADTWVEKDFDKAIIRCLADVNVVWGGLWKRFRDPVWLMYGSRFRCWTRWMLSSRAFGDQGIFILKSTLNEIGGFPDVPLMEEFELAKRIRKNKVGEFAIADTNVFTSIRKFRKLGILRTYWRMGVVTFLYYCGVPFEKLDQIYRK